MCVCALHNYAQPPNCLPNHRRASAQRIPLGDSDVRLRSRLPRDGVSQLGLLGRYMSLKANAKGIGRRYVEGFFEGLAWWKDRWPMCKSIGLRDMYIYILDRNVTNKKGVYHEMYRFSCKIYCKQFRWARNQPTNYWIFMWYKPAHSLTITGPSHRQKILKSPMISIEAGDWPQGAPWVLSHWEFPPVLSPSFWAAKGNITHY